MLIILIIVILGQVGFFRGIYVCTLKILHQDMPVGAYCILWHVLATSQCRGETILKGKNVPDICVMHVYKENSKYKL